LKKLLSLMVAMGLTVGLATFAFAQEEKKGEEKKEMKKKKKKKAAEGEEKKPA
jgi:uncharacterized protein HemX